MTVYTVQAGDTLEKIAERHLGSKSEWSRIYDRNANSMTATFKRAKPILDHRRPHQIKDAWDYLEIGQKLELPD